MSDRLREMLASSTPGPWKSSDARVLAYGNSGIADCKLHRAPSRQRANAALIALAPDAIALLADMGEAAEEYRSAVRPDPRDYHERQAANAFDAVLARLDALCGDDR